MQDTHIYEGAIVFTDMKDFTFRSSVLDKKNLDTLIENQNKLILPIVKKHSGKVVKTIGDSFMIIFRDVKDAIEASVEIQQTSQKYNHNKKTLQQIEFRIAIAYGELSETQGLHGNDYFGYTVNLASRLLIQTRANKILVTKTVIDTFSGDIVSLHLGDMSFKGMLKKEPVYEILWDRKDIENYKEGKLKKDAFRLEIEEKIKDTPREIEDTIFKVSAVTAIVSIQPIPFLDIYTSAPLHMYMIHTIGKQYGLELHMSDVKDILSTIGVGLGGAYALSQGFLAVSKIGLPVIGGYIAVPFSFGFTYALGKTISAYFYYRSQNTYISDVEIREVFEQSKSIGIKKAKSQKSEVLSVGKEHKESILSHIKLFEKKTQK